MQSFELGDTLLELVGDEAQQIKVSVVDGAVAVVKGFVEAIYYRNTDTLEPSSVTLDDGYTYGLASSEMKFAFSIYGSLKVGVELSTKDDFSLSSTSQLLARGLEDSVFSVSVDTLSANTTYYYRSFISLGNLNLYGAKASFTTKDFESPTLSGEATDLTFTSAKVSYEIPDLTLSERESIITVIAYSTDAKKLSADKRATLEEMLGRSKTSRRDQDSCWML